MLWVTNGIIISYFDKSDIRKISFVNFVVRVLIVPMVDDVKFGVCPACNKPLSKTADARIARLVNSICLVIGVMALMLVWSLRNPGQVQQQMQVALSPWRTAWASGRQSGAGVYGGRRRAHHNVRQVTARQFHRLKPAMNYRRVKSILRASGTRTGQTRAAGVLTEIYLWQNPDGSNVSVVFRNHKLAAKAQFHLEPGAQNHAS
jgi:hypothetical protein